MEYRDFNKPDGVSINEVGMIIFGDKRGLLIVTEDANAPPMDIIDIPQGFQDEYQFTLVISPNVAHFLGALQREKQGLEVEENDVVAGRLMWWLVIDNARQRIEVKDDS